MIFTRYIWKSRQNQLVCTRLIYLDENERKRAESKNAFAGA